MVINLINSNMLWSAKMKHVFLYQNEVEVTRMHFIVVKWVHITINQTIETQLIRNTVTNCPSVKNPTIFPNLSISSHQNPNFPHLHNSINETPLKSRTVPSKSWHQATRQRVQSQLLINKKHTLLQNNLIVEFIVKNHRRVLVQKSCWISIFGPANPAQLGLQTRVHVGVLEPVAKETTVRQTDGVRSQERDHFIQWHAVCGEGLLHHRHRGTWPWQRHVRSSRHDAVTSSRWDVVSGPTCHGHGITCGQGYYIRAWNRWRARCFQRFFYFVY